MVNGLFKVFIKIRTWLFVKIKHANIKKKLKKAVFTVLNKIHNTSKGKIQVSGLLIIKFVFINNADTIVKLYTIYLLESHHGKLIIIIK